MPNYGDFAFKSGSHAILNTVCFIAENHLSRTVFDKKCQVTS